MGCLSRDTALFRKGCGLVWDQPQLLGLYFSSCGSPPLVVRLQNKRDGTKVK